MVAIFVLIITILILLLIDSSKKMNNIPFVPYEDALPPLVQGVIPKIIWTFWDSDKAPELVIHCFKNMKKYNPDWSLVILSPKNLSKYTDEDILGMKMSNTPQRTSDLVRMAILEKYGGVWCDASLILNSSLNWIYRYEGYEYIGYYIEKSTTRTEYPVIENWFFACVTGCHFMSMWKEEFFRINEYDTPEDYTDSVIAEGVDVQNICFIYYLTMHVAAQKVIQKRMTLQEFNSTIKLLKAEDGPFKLMDNGMWNIEYGLRAARDEHHPIVKIIGPSRDSISKSHALTDLATSLPGPPPISIQN